VFNATFSNEIFDKWDDLECVFFSACRQEGNRNCVILKFRICIKREISIWNKTLF
jgi:hypothetical protein